MNIRRITALVSIVCALCLLLSSCGVIHLLTYSNESETGWEQTVDEDVDKSDFPPTKGETSTPLMWRVTGENCDGELYLLGSIHVGLFDTNQYPEEVTDAFGECEYLAVESDVIALEQDMAAQIESLRYLIYSDGSSISDHISPELFDRSRAVMDHYGAYNAMMDMYKPIMWQQIIEQSLTLETKYDFDYGVDRYFLNEAKGLYKSILEIEDYRQTYAALGSLSDATQEYLLAQSVQPAYVKNYGTSIDLLYGMWKKGDLQGLEEYLFSEDGAELSDEEQRMMEEYNDMLLYDRNKAMADRAEEYLRDGLEVFYIVGLAHMLGEDGLVKELTRSGYFVEAVEYE